MSFWFPFKCNSERCIVQYHVGIPCWLPKSWLVQSRKGRANHATQDKCKIGMDVAASEFKVPCLSLLFVWGVCHPRVLISRAASPKSGCSTITLCGFLCLKGVPLFVVGVEGNPKGKTSQCVGSPTLRQMFRPWFPLCRHVFTLWNERGHEPQIWGKPQLSGIVMGRSKGEWVQGHPSG